MEVLRGPSPAQHPFSFWLARDGGEQRGSWAGGWGCGGGRNCRPSAGSRGSQETMKKLDPAGAANTEEHGHVVRAMASPC